MNDKDKEAFKVWYINKKSEFDNCKEAWQAACEYKQKEIDEQKELIDFCEQRLHENLKSLIELENTFIAPSSENALFPVSNLLGPRTRYLNSKLNKQINELEKEKDYLFKKMENMRAIYKDSEKLEAENAKLRECVEFYALTSNWDEHCLICDEDHEYIPKWYETIGGKRARQCLKELRKE